MFIPSSVIHGFTIGVAFIIGLNQINSAFGLSGLVPHESFREVGTSPPSPISLFLLLLALDCRNPFVHIPFLTNCNFQNIWESLTHLNEADWKSLLIFSLTTAAYLALIHKWPKAPWAILIAVLGILLGILTSNGKALHLAFHPIHLTPSHLHLSIPDIHF